MATRSTIKIEGNSFAKVYVHWDGYPEHMLPWLEEFNKEFTKNRGDCPTYKFAQLLRFSERHKRKFNLDRSKFTGWGVIEFDQDYDADFEYALHGDGSVTYKKTY